MESNSFADTFNPGVGVVTHSRTLYLAIHVRELLRTWQPGAHDRRPRDQVVGDVGRHGPKAEKSGCHSHANDLVAAEPSHRPLALGASAHWDLARPVEDHHAVEVEGPPAVAAQCSVTPTSVERFDDASDHA